MDNPNERIVENIKITYPSGCATYEIDQLVTRIMMGYHVQGEKRLAYKRFYQGSEFLTCHKYGVVGGFGDKISNTLCAGNQKLLELENTLHCDSLHKCHKGAAFDNTCYCDQQTYEIGITAPSFKQGTVKLFIPIAEREMFTGECVGIYSYTNMNKVYSITLCEQDQLHRMIESDVQINILTTLSCMSDCGTIMHKLAMNNTYIPFKGPCEKTGGEISAVSMYYVAVEVDNTFSDEVLKHVSISDRNVYKSATYVENIKRDHKISFVTTNFSNMTSRMFIFPRINIENDPYYHKTWYKSGAIHVKPLIKTYTTMLPGGDPTAPFLAEKIKAHYVSGDIHDEELFEFAGDLFRNPSEIQFYLHNKLIKYKEERYEGVSIKTLPIINTVEQDIHSVRHISHTDATVLQLPRLWWNDGINMDYDHMLIIPFSVGSAEKKAPVKGINLTRLPSMTLNLTLHDHILQKFRDQQIYLHVVYVGHNVLRTDAKGQFPRLG